jgi:Protein of unknown function (DUF3987)
MKQSTIKDFAARMKNARISSSSVSDEWPTLDNAALYGLAGDIVHTLDPHTEADPAAILVQSLVMFGSAASRGPHATAEADRHGSNMYVALVGETSKGRKGTAFGQVRGLFNLADPKFDSDQIKSGLSSGEGLIWAVRDQVEKQEPIKQRGLVVGYQNVIVDPGVLDKRLLDYESELALVLRVLSREGNTLSAIIRQAWETGTLRTLTKNAPAVATGAHIAIIAHITKQELLRHLDSTELANGFANRFLWVCVKRSKLLPEGGNLPETERQRLAREIVASLNFAHNVQLVRRDAKATELWREVYPTLSDGKPGIFGAVTSRSEAQVLRLALIYALLDRSGEVRVEHLAAALAMWSYAEDSARYIFGDATGDGTADEILRALRSALGGLTRTEISSLFGRNAPASRISSALDLLRSLGLAKSSVVTGSGRPAETWFAS